MKRLLVMLLLIVQACTLSAYAQENMPPKFYDAAFKMPTGNPVRVDGFYFLTDLHYDTVPSVFKKNEKVATVTGIKTIYQFYPDGSFYYRDFLDRGAEKIKEKLINDEDWVRKLPRLFKTQCWGFYKIQGDTLLLEYYVTIYKNALKGIKDDSFYRYQKRFQLANGILTEPDPIKPANRPGHSEIRTITFIETPYRVDYKENDLLTNKKFLKTTGFQPAVGH